MAQDSPTGMLWSLADRLGSIDTLTDKDGNVVDKRTFDSFGRVLSQSNPSISFRYGYTGRERDLESGLDFYRARYYDSNVGRFISVDPMGFGAGDTNLYRYVGNNATNYTDPSGNFAFLLPLAYAAGVTVAAGVSAAAFGGVAGFAQGVAQSIDSDRRNGILGWDSIGSAYINGLIGAGKGAAAGFVIGTVGTAAALGAVALGVPTAVVGGVGLGVGVLGVGSGVISAGNNFAQGNYATGLADLGTSIYGGTKLWSAYQASRLRLYEEPNPSLLNSSGEIVPVGSSVLANRTSVGSAIVPYNNAGGALALAGASSNSLSQSTATGAGIRFTPVDSLSGSEQFQLTPRLSQYPRLSYQTASKYLDKHLPNTPKSNSVIRQKGMNHVFNDRETLIKVERAILERGEYTGNTGTTERYGLKFDEPIGYRIDKDGNTIPLTYGELKVLPNGDYHVIPRPRARKS